MSDADEEWVRAAMSDDSMVAELLLRLRHAPPYPLFPKRAALPLRWSVRQRRSKPASANSNPKKLALKDRGSPTTPLSWSGATSEESSRSTPPIKLSDTRSKVNVNTDSDKTNSKSSRKKKSFAELKDEENSLLKERRDLKKEMAALRLCLQIEKATNGNLKRMKAELQPHLDIKSKPESVANESISGLLQLESPVMLLPVVEATDVKLILEPSNACPEEEQADARFFLPDLNMPFDEPIPELICGISS